MVRLLILVLALSAGGAAVWLSVAGPWQPEPEVRTVTVTVPMTEVLVPKTNLRRGATLRAAHLAWTDWPETQIQPGMILRTARPDAIAELAGHVTRSDLFAGEPVRGLRLASGDAGFLSLVLEEGFRALAVPISASAGAGGFILPDDRVDVIHTIVRDVDGDGEASGASRTLLTNVRVLAIGQTTLDRAALSEETAKDEQDAPSPVVRGDTATLELSPRQAEIVSAALSSGRLTLALRAAVDFGLPGIGSVEMLEGSAPPPPPPAPAPAPLTAAAPAGAGAEAAPWETGRMARSTTVLVISGATARVVDRSAPRREDDGEPDTRDGANASDAQGDAARPTEASDRVSPIEQTGERAE